MKSNRFFNKLKSFFNIKKKTQTKPGFSGAVPLWVGQTVPTPLIPTSLVPKSLLINEILQASFVGAVVSNSCRQFHFSQAFCKFIEAIFVFFGVKSSWLHQQVLTEATSNSCDWRLTLFALLYPRQRKLSPSMSRKIWIQIRWLLEFQVRWIPTKRSLRVLYSSVEEQLYICSVRVLLFLLTVGA